MSTAHCSLARYRCRAEKHSSQQIFRLKEISWYLVCMSLPLVGWIEKAASVFFVKTFGETEMVSHNCRAVLQNLLLR